MALPTLPDQQLLLYNMAMRFCGESRLTATEDREPRRVLDDIWNAGALKFCLEQGLWNFAMRVIELTYNPIIQPGFGYQRAFDKPADYVRTAFVNMDQFFRWPFNDYDDKERHLYANVDTLYMQFVSNDAAYGADFTLWTEAFRKWVGAWMGLEGFRNITGKDADDKKKEDVERLLRSARSKDAMNEASRSMPPGTWALAHRGGRYMRGIDGAGSLGSIPVDAG